MAERARLDELRLVALEDRAVASLALGHHATVAAEVEALTAAHPLRERLWALQALALVRSGRQADALEVLRKVREVLDEELGLEPSAELRDLQTAVLRQDPALEWVAPAAGAAAPGPVAAPVAATRPTPHPATEQVAPWPMVGRDADLESLVDVVERCRARHPVVRRASRATRASASPGWPRSWCCGRGSAGIRVLIGRCSQDDGAPPLWPWKTVLDGIGMSLLAEEQDAAEQDEGGQFRAWERIVQGLREAAARRADHGGPRRPALGRHLDPAGAAAARRDHRPGPAAGASTPGGLHPEPTGALADVAEALARMHALRLQLSGLPQDQMATVFESVTSRELDPADAAALYERTDGNPFFLVEFARLAGERGEPGAPRRRAADRGHRRAQPAAAAAARADRDRAARRPP